MSTGNDGHAEGFELFDLGGGFTSTLGPIYRHQDEARLRWRVEERHLNPVGACHGGAMATFADLQIAVLKLNLGAESGHLPTITLTVDYLAPVRCGQWVEMDVSMIKMTRTLAFTQAIMTVESNVVARSTGIYRRFSK